MDIDARQQTSLEVPVDDDLINYESDAADYSLTTDQGLGNGATSETLQDAHPSVEPTIASGNTDTGETLGGLAVDSAAEAFDTVVEDNADDQQNIRQAVEAELPLDADAAGAALDVLTEAVAEEIDYGLGEVDYNGEQNFDVTHEVENEDATHNDAETAALDVFEDKAEISWEDDAVGHGTEEVEKEENEEDGQRSAQTYSIRLGDTTEEANAQSDESESRDSRQDALQALETAITWDASTDETGIFQPNNADAHFPTITVQYQGDEFPFLSSGTEGFFSDSSILDDSMQRVFSGFRSQLKNEVTAEDELVFQIDELGLEFTESNPSFSLTMHQILEVFDLLIKNDDPDGRRTLYTYLFTRVNSAKRYDFLVESATSGKSLEEVQHIFSQQSLRNGSDGDNADDSAMSSEHPEDHSEEEYGGEQLDDGEDDEHHEHHDEHHADFAEEDAEEHSKEYHEAPADDHQEVEYFDQAIPQDDEVSRADDEAMTTHDAPENVDAEEHDNSFAHEHSSTTSTLQGDADGTALADDETAVDAEADGPVFVTEANEDAEIDWRDEDENEVAGEGGSVTGKRSRDDNDEPDLDDDIDFKRRRP
ncbi:hypothetical protein V2A60_009064 [Cordyceps javanica]|uniref:Glutamic acid-rich protein n=1 Tax=Cordyceps javanica TaxID=43265 RepID=A0A545VP03_9HYPO|nr:glutamic acid-rich protein [Cordyceps javanica]TQW03443.1 glutamic acid-rich protein [Cordyceps javanica]